MSLYACLQVSTSVPVCVPLGYLIDEYFCILSFATSLGLFWALPPAPFLPSNTLSSPVSRGLWQGVALSGGNPCSAELGQENPSKALPAPAQLGQEPTGARVMAEGV